MRCRAHVFRRFSASSSTLPSAVVLWASQLLGTCAGVFFVAAMAVLDLGAPVALVSVAVVVLFLLISGAAVFSGFFWSALLLLGSTTPHSSPPCSFGGGVIWAARGATEWSALLRGSGVRGGRAPKRSSMAPSISGPSSSILFFNLSIHAHYRSACSWRVAGLGGRAIAPWAPMSAGGP
jgi:hypothetical protein